MFDFLLMMINFLLTMMNFYLRWWIFCWWCSIFCWRWWIFLFKMSNFCWKMSFFFAQVRASILTKIGSNLANRWQNQWFLMKISKIWAKRREFDPTASWRLWALSDFCIFLQKTTDPRGGKGYPMRRRPPERDLLCFILYTRFVGRRPNPRKKTSIFRLYRQEKWGPSRNFKSRPISCVDKRIFDQKTANF